MTNSGSPDQSEFHKGLTYPFGRSWAPKQGQIFQVADSVYWFHMPLPFSLKRINLWLLEDGEGWTVVDTGLNTPESREYWESALLQHLGGRPINRVIVTHMHPDHIGLAGWLSYRFNCDLFISRQEILMCRALVSDMGREAPDVAIRFYRSTGLDQKAMEEYRQRFGGFGKFISKLPDSSQRLCDGQIIEINSRYWQVIVGTGHSPEHVCLYCPALKLLISGDQVLPRITPNVSVFPSEPNGDPLSEWLQSCNKIRTLLPDNLLVLPAHEQPFYGLHTRVTQLVEGHERSLVKLYDFLSEPRRAVECFPILFERDIKPGILELAIGETIAHLNCLINRRMATCVKDKSGVSYYQRSENIY